MKDEWEAKKKKTIRKKKWEGRRENEKAWYVVRYL